MTSSTPTRASIPVRLVALGVVAALVLFLAGALFAGNASAAPERLVWICKYVGAPDNPRFNRVMSVSTSATDGTWFNDGQLPSKVIRAVAEGEGVGRAPAGLDEACPATPPGHAAPSGPQASTGKVTTATVLPKAAPTDLGSTQTTGIFSLFALAATLLGGAALALRRGGGH